MSQWRELTRSDCENLKELDKGIKNCFRWAWLEEKDNGQFMSDYIRKINIPGMSLTLETLYNVTAYNDTAQAYIPLLKECFKTNRARWQASLINTSFFCFNALSNLLVHLTEFLRLAYHGKSC